MIPLNTKHRIIVYTLVLFWDVVFDEVKGLHPSDFKSQSRWEAAAKHWSKYSTNLELKDKANRTEVKCTSARLEPGKTKYSTGKATSDAGQSERDRINQLPRFRSFKTAKEGWTKCCWSKPWSPGEEFKRLHLIWCLCYRVLETYKMGRKGFKIIQMWPTKNNFLMVWRNFQDLYTRCGPQMSPSQPIQFSWDWSFPVEKAFYIVCFNCGGNKADPGPHTFK